MGQLGITRFDPDRLALEVANQMLGGSGFNSLLMRELRVKRGYTYGAYSTINSTQARGVFNISYSTRQDQLLDSIRVAHKTLLDFVQQPLDQKQLEETKAGMLRAFPMNFSSNASMNAQLGAIGFYGLPANYLAQYSKQLANLTTKDVEKAVKLHLNPENLTLVIVSETLDKQAIQSILEQNLNSQITSPAASKPIPSANPLPPVPDNASPVSVQTDTPASI